MFFFVLIILLSFLINFIYLIYDEVFLLGLYFILFFFIAYILLKNKFKALGALKILKKYVLFRVLFKINLSCNSLLKIFFVISKNLLNKFIVKLIFFKSILNNIIAVLLNKYKILLSLFFLLFLYNKDYAEKSLVALAEKVSLNDISLCY